MADIWKEVTNAADELRQRAWEYTRENDDLKTAFADFNDALDKCMSAFYNDTHE